MRDYDLAALDEVIAAERKRAVQLEANGKHEEALLGEAYLRGMVYARHMLTGEIDRQCYHPVHDQRDGVWYCKTCGVKA